MEILLYTTYQVCIILVVIIDFSLRVHVFFLGWKDFGLAIFLYTIVQGLRFAGG